MRPSDWGLRRVGLEMGGEGIGVHFLSIDRDMGLALDNQVPPRAVRDVRGSR